MLARGSFLLSRCFESDQRAVQWVDPEKAISLIAEPELKAIVAAFAKRVATAASKLSY
jgi:hypothetical protein